MGRQSVSKYFPTRFPGPGMVFDQGEADADDPGADPRGEYERLGGSFVDVQLDDAQILALAAAPITILQSPGALRAIVVDAVFMFLDVVDGAYDDVAADGDLNLRYVGGGDASAGFNIQADGFIDAAADAARFFAHAHDYVAEASLVVTPEVDVGIEIDNDGAEFTTVANDTAANTLSIRVYYHIIDMVAFT